MKRGLSVLVAALGLGCLQAATAAAATIGYFDVQTQVDGAAPVIHSPAFSGGTLTINVSGSGPHSVLGFFDLEIDEAINTFYNETGSAVGVAPVGLSWEIDEPGFNPPYGDIYNNFLAGTLDNTNASGSANDVSMALGWSFSLNMGETGIVSFVTGTTAPTGFYLAQFDPDSQATVYLSSSLVVRPDGGVIPEPGTLILLGSGLLGLAGWGRKRRKS